MNKLPWIDALRGLAIFSVLIYHTSQHLEGLPFLLKAVSSQGARGVQLFYLVSAFTLFLSLDNRKKSERHPLINFFIRRFFRIAPLFYCAIAFYVWKTGIGPNYWLEDGHSLTIPNLIAHLTFTNGWHPYWINSILPVGWSIAIEMPFYLIVPYLFKNIKSLDKAVWLTFATLLISKIIFIILYSNHFILEKLGETFLFYWLPNQLPFFFYGDYSLFSDTQYSYQAGTV
jgi:peptidoglycan/LPS O-acetylase OafA/YrhL